MDFDNYEFKGIIGFFVAIATVLLSPLVLVWGAVIDIIEVIEMEEGHILPLKDKIPFYCLGVYAVIISIIGMVASCYGIYHLVSWISSSF